jgi:hypothetical protein
MTADQPLTKAASGFLCPRCGKPLTPLVVGLQCFNCQFLHPGLLTPEQTATILDRPVDEVWEMIEQGQLQFRVWDDSIRPRGKARGPWVDLTLLWNHPVFGRRAFERRQKANRKTQGHR